MEFDSAYTPLPLPDPRGPLPEPGRLPPGSQLPYNRNALFTGREAELRALAQALLCLTGAGSAAGTLLSQTLQGLGGVGKTQLAVEFAYRYGRFFHGVHWLNAQQPQLLEAEIARCGFVMAPALGLSAWPQELPEQLALTLHAWATGGPRLIVLDNLEEPAPARAWLATLQQTPCRVLITARRAQWSADLGLELLPIACFTREESRAFLRRHFGAAGAAAARRADGDGELDALHARLGGLPLALELAARYLATRPRLSVPAYLAQLGNAFADPAMARFRNELGNPTGHDLDLAATFSLSWESVPEGAARELFLLAGFCAPNVPVPCSLLERAAQLDEASCDGALDALRTLGLLDAENALHPLLAEYARHVAAPEGEAGGRLAALTDALARLAYDANMTGLPAKFAPLRPHVEALAPEAERAGVEDAAALWVNLGYHLRGVADLAGARAAFERALRIDEAVYGTEHPEVATDVNNLGGVLRDLGDLAGARAAFERALRIDEAVYGTEHPNVAICINNLGLVLQDLGDLAGARAALERALRIDEAVYGPEHPNVARDVNNLGGVLRALGDLAGARSAYERALRIFERFLPPGHPNIAVVRENLEIVEQELAAKGL